MTEKLDLDHLRQWIGRASEASDIVTAQLVKGLRATLLQEIGEPKAGDAAPFTVHWCLAQPVFPMSMLGPDGPVHPTPTARSLAAAVLHPPVGPLPPRLYDWLMWPSLAILPPAVRAEYGIAWTPSRAGVAGWLTAGMATWAHRLPAAWRSMPQARAADRRIRSASIGSP